MKRTYRKLVFTDDALLVGSDVNAEAGILHNITRTRHAFTVRPDQLAAGVIAWGRVLRDTRLAGTVGHLQ